MQLRGQPLPIEPAQPTTTQPTQKQATESTQPSQRLPIYSPPKPYRNGDAIKRIKLGIDTAIDQLNRIEFPDGKRPVQSTQNVSSYGVKSKKKKTVIILVICLILLLGILGAVFYFKDQILTFFDNSEFFSGLF